MKGSDFQNSQLADEEVNHSPGASQQVAVQTGAPEQQVEFLKEGIKSRILENVVVRVIFNVLPIFVFMESIYSCKNSTSPVYIKGLSDF